MIDFRKKGGRLFVSAPYDEDFITRAKELGGKWSPQEKAWSFPDDRDVVEGVEKLIREIYGVDVHKPLVWAKLTYTGKDFWEALRGPVTIGGAELAIARGRDSGARVGENVFLLEGRICSGGSVKRWTSVVKPGAVFKALIYRDSVIPEKWEVEYLEDEPVDIGEGPLEVSEMEELPEAELRKKGEEALERLLFMAKEAADLPIGWIETANRKLTFVDRAKEVIWIEFLTGASFPEEEKLVLRAVMEFVKKHGRLPG